MWPHQHPKELHQEVGLRPPFGREDWALVLSHHDEVLNLFEHLDLTFDLVRSSPPEILPDHTFDDPYHTQIQII